MVKKEVLIKSKYIGVYERDKGLKPWRTSFYIGDISFSIYSDSEDKAALKYNILATFFYGKTAILNNIEVSPVEYKKIAKEVYYQLTVPSEVQKSVSSQGCKKLMDASSEYVGVCKHKKFKLYYAYISKEKKRYSLGYYKTNQEAGAAYNIAAEALYGDLAKLNEIDMNWVDEKFIKHVIAKLNINR